MQSSSSCPLPSTWTSKIGQVCILSHFLSDGLSKGGDNTESLVNPYRVLRQNLYRFHVCLYVFAGRLSLRQHEDFFISLESEFSDLEGVSIAEVFTEACLMIQYAQGRLMGTVEEGMTSIISRIRTLTRPTSKFLVTLTFSRKHERVKLELMGLATVSMLFSILSAALLSSSVTQDSTDLNDAVNALWFSSLLLGIFSAISSLLGMEWHSITKWSPRPNNPGFVKNSLKCNNSLLIAFFNSPEGAYTSKRHFNTNTEN